MGIISGAGRLRAAAALLATSLLWTALCAAAPLSGRSVQEVLRELAGSGLNIIFSSDTVPASLKVLAEPASPGGVAAVREILAAHGLALVSVDRDAWAVVRDATVPPPVAAPAMVVREAPALSEIVVTTSRYALAGNETDPHVFLSQAAVQALPKLADEPLRAVQQLPGSASSGVSALTHLRGGDYNEVLMVLDGLPLNEPFHLKNYLAPVSVLDAEAIGSIDVSSGGFTANHGDRISGIIDITPLAPPADRYTVLGLSLFHVNGLSAGRFDDSRGQWLLSARRSNLDLLADVTESDVGTAGYYDIFGRVTYAPGEDTELFAGGLLSDDELKGISTRRTRQLVADYHNKYVWAGWRQGWAQGWSSQLILAFTEIESNRSGNLDQPGQRVGSVNDDRRLDVAIARLDVEKRGALFYTRMGAEARESHGEYRYRSSLDVAPGWPFPGDPGSSQIRELAPTPESHQFALYATSRMRLGDRLSAEFGLRWDDQRYDDQRGPRELSPRVNLMYDWSAATRLRAAWGRFWQSQAVNELQVEDGVATFYQPQRADHLIVSLEQTLSAGLDLRIEAYVKDYERVWPHFENLFDPVRLLPELEADRVRVAPASSRARGVEALLRRRGAGPWSWWLGYSWSRVTDEIDGRDVPRSWDQRHSINAGLRYVGQRWEATLTDSFHTGWPTTALDLAIDPGSGLAVAAMDPRNGARYGNFNSFDFRVLRRFDLAASTLEAFFEMTNALGQRNGCCTSYRISGSGAAASLEPEQDYWPRLIPNLGVTWRF